MLKTSKWNWAGHAARAKDNRALDIMKWNTIGKRKRGRPKTSWTTDLVKPSGNNWAEWQKIETCGQAGGRPSSSSGTETTDNDDDDKGVQIILGGVLNEWKRVVFQL